MSSQIALLDAGGARRIDLRRVSADLAALQNLLGRRWVWAGMDDGLPCLITIDRVVGARELPQVRSAACVWQGLEFWVVGVSSLALALCGFDPWLGEEGGQTRPAEVGWRLREVLAALNNRWFKNPSKWVQPVAEVDLWHAADEGLLSLECSIWSPDGVWLDRMWIVPTGSREPLERLPRLLRASGLLEREVDGDILLPIHLPAAIGEVCLPWSRLRSVQEGDVICFDRTWLSERNKLEVNCQAGRLRFRILSPDRLELIEPVQFSHITKGSVMDEALRLGELSLDSEHDEGPKTQDALEAVPVSLVAVAGSINLSVADLARIKVGDCVRLDSPAQPLVRLVANGKTVGVGELIDIEGRLGVQVSRWDVTG